MGPRWKVSLAVFRCLLAGPQAVFGRSKKMLKYMNNHDIVNPHFYRGLMTAWGIWNDYFSISDRFVDRGLHTMSCYLSGSS